MKRTALAIALAISLTGVLGVAPAAAVETPTVSTYQTVCLKRSAMPPLGVIGDPTDPIVVGRYLMYCQLWDDFALVDSWCEWVGDYYWRPLRGEAPPEVDTGSFIQCVVLEG